jgi:PDZ domain-containing protein
MTARADPATTTAITLIIKVDTLNSTVLPTDVAPDPGEGERAKPRHPWRWLSVLIGLVLIGVVASLTVYLPYYAYTPGSATDTEGVIKIDGARSYPSDGEIDYTTVRIQHLTPWRAFMAWRDPAIDVVSENSYLGNLSPSENKAFNLQLMGDSKQAAIYVALTKLGYDIPVSGGGAVVRDISPDVPAAKVLQVGDVIVAVDGTPVHLDSDLGPILEPHKPGDQVTLTIERPSGTGDPSAAPTYDTITRTVELAARDDGTALIGIAPGTRNDVKFDFPVDVDIDSGSVGGPSAGLAFTLGVIDALTPGELTGGEKVATTGTISLDGTVGAVGGVKQKAVTVERAGAKVFLVPAAEADEARSALGDNSDLEIVPVENVDDALDALAAIGGNAHDLATAA